MLQVDRDLVQTLHRHDFDVAIETNGTVEIKDEVVLDWVCCSPKNSKLPIRLQHVDEIKYVITATSDAPVCRINAGHCLLSPAFDGNTIQPGALERCLSIIAADPSWRLSVQQHKLWGIP
jgi:organic radical activating enzyme